MKCGKETMKKPNKHPEIWLSWLYSPSKTEKPSNSSYEIQFVNTKFMDLMGNVVFYISVFFFVLVHGIGHELVAVDEATHMDTKHSIICLSRLFRFCFCFYSPGSWPLERNVFKKFARLATNLGMHLIPFRFLRSTFRSYLWKLDIL